MTDMEPAPGAESKAVAPSRASRFIRFPLVLMVIAILFFAAAATLGNLLHDFVPRPDGSPLRLLNPILIIFLLTAAYWAFCRWVERAPMQLLARDGAAKELAAGLAGGALLFSLVVGVAAALGGYRIAGWGASETIWAALAAAIGAGFAEELLFRGILFRYLELTAGSWVALLVTSALFGAAHIGNDNASLVSTAAIAVEAGILLGAVYMLTRRLWAAIGLHAAWNFTQGWVYGLPVSGIGGGDGLVRGQLTGPEMLTGGAFGLEASLVGVVVATSAGVAILVVAGRRGEFMAPMWRRRGPASA